MTPEKSMHWATKPVRTPEPMFPCLSTLLTANKITTTNTQLFKTINKEDALSMILPRKDNFSVTVGYVLNIHGIILKPPKK